VNIGPQYGTLGPFRPPGVTRIRWFALLVWKRGTVLCGAGFKGKRHA
jgi:hypothetical protein